MHKLSDTIERKFVDTIDINDYEIWTDTGWEDVTSIHKTVEYIEWVVELENGMELICADDHIVFDENLNEVFVKNLKRGDHIITEEGPIMITAVYETCNSSNMYDVSVNSPNHRLYTNGILSHNTTTATAVILHYLLFNESKTVALLANKADAAREIMDRIQMAYQNLPKWLQQGVKEWNKGSITLENGCKAIAAASSASSIRGKSIAFLYIDEAAFLENWEEFYSSVYPTISSGKETKILLTSCVTSDTLVWDSTRGLVEVSTYVEDNGIEHPNLGYIIPDYKVYGKSKFNSGNTFVNSGVANVRHIKSSHSEIKCSDEHKLWACKNGEYGWFKSKDLSIGDFISIYTPENPWVGDDDISDFTYNGRNGNNSKVDYGNNITNDMAYLFGLYLAEGCMSDKSGNKNVTISSGDEIPEIISDIVGHNISNYDGLHSKITNSKLVELFKHVGLKPQVKAPQKTIPNRLLRMSKSNIANMLSGMFDGDGCALDRSRNRVVYYSSSEKMIDQVRILLNSFGILSKKAIYTTPPTKKVKVSSICYRLEIDGIYADIFYDEIGFRIKRKQSRRKTNISKRTDGHNIIPFAYQNYKLKRNGIHKKNKHLSKETFIQQIGIVEGISETNLYWEKIKEISDYEDKVYDFSLDHIEGDKWCHSVVYNGVLGHQTPKGLNHFYKFCSEAMEIPDEAKEQGSNIGRNGFIYIEVAWNRIPERDEKWKNETLASMHWNYDQFNQEFCCSFIGSSDTLISSQALANLVAKIPIQTLDNIKIYSKPNPNRKYILVADVSKGKKLDYSAFSVIDVTQMPYNQVCTYRSNETGPIDYAAVIYNIAQLYNNAHVLVELNNIGSQVADCLWIDFGYEYLLSTVTKGRSGKKISSGFAKNAERGITTSEKVKIVGCSILKMLIEQQQLLINDEMTIHELKRFSKKNNSYAAELGSHDDTVMPLVLFSWLSDQGYFKNMTDINTLSNLRETTDEEVNNMVLNFFFINNGNNHFEDDPIDF